MSGASGKVPAAIHVSPEALGQGPLAFVRDGDIIRLCANRGALDLLADVVDVSHRTPAPEPLPEEGLGRELFGMFRSDADTAEAGASAMLRRAGL
jgi:phosphogluconate dehydratase